MENILCNMIKINRGNDVLVLDKVKKYGWEGLTFPGGHVEKMESITDSVIREAKEETNLDVENIRYIGMISWYDMDNNDRIVGFLYETDDFSGELVKENIEGTLEFIDYEELKNMDGHSDSMDEIFAIYDGKYSEIVLYYEDNKCVKKECYK
ncbi:MAG: NUDIX domain-containing protein [Finegoldia magna]|uniref:Mutator protein MutT/nudix family n=2 Tax=Finegoldia magna TaxID=1260 RepID=B0S0T4_FINM2|nr:NUDIX domain-containing protein [Finegoldia magna]EFK94246.1 hydrolase, NUDIX family [Finegoldia magna ACS-171-V-Col3]EFL54252.1 hydrolase, NUDIX family [Finegoldia magna BVS033A4]MDU5272449.1 NUDIX domain-containing protein [Finegoldia magna]MDU5363274.1 NUDIX domain-containing protein [Finegoldia magna]OXZ41607.1 DNA mismatch repair protein MutT [Finegoldia magna]